MDKIDISRRFTYLIILISAVILIFIFFVNHWQSVNVFFHRVLSHTSELSVGGIVSVKLAQSREDKGPDVADWAVLWRTRGKMSIHAVSFSEQKSENKEEYLELKAQIPLDLTNGFIGNGERLFEIDCPNNIYLERGDVVRVYTSYKETSDTPCSGKEAGEKIIARAYCGNFYKEKAGDYCPGLYRDHLNSYDSEEGRKEEISHDGDRIIVLDSEGDILLDLDYWWIRREQ